MAAGKALLELFDMEMYPGDVLDGMWLEGQRPDQPPVFS